MKRYILFLFCLSAFTICCWGQKEKIVERSAKKAPEWIGKSNTDYFSVSATAETLEKAKEQCLNEIRQHIISTIAVNITAAEQLMQQSYSSNTLKDALTQYTSQVDTRSAQMPFLTGISLSNAKDVYWERRMVKSDKRYFYIYHVYYPFSEYERADAIAQFKRLDSEYEHKLVVLENKYREFTNLDYIREAIAELNSLSGYFFDSARLARVEALRKAFNNCLADVVVEEGAHGVKQINYTLSLHGRKVTTSRKPTFSSNYADNIKMTPLQDGVYSIKYEPVAIAGEEHTIEMKYLLDGRTLSHKFLFDPYDGQCAISIASAIELTSVNDSIMQIGISIRTNSPNPFTIQGVQVKFDSDMPMIFFDDLNQTYEGKESHLLLLNVNKNNYSIGAQGVASGVLKIATRLHSGYELYDFKVPYKIN